ncbi:hypothetical protein PIB30_011529 [Stylosanthes scabra]|uniref:Uncharacterized protein n=1 Tax=Stylosanthes scabra TaxID=79078 RepID=A0ABU6T678_9FABA|nr:hypothetical protein [Stylosanthes scabra]
MAENMRFKSLEVELKRLGQRIEDVSDETRAEHARAASPHRIGWGGMGLNPLLLFVRPASKGEVPATRIHHGDNGYQALGPGDSRFLKSSFSLSYWIANSTVVPSPLASLLQ